MSNLDKYPCLQEFAQDVGLRADHMVEAFEEEKLFFNKVYKEKSAECRAGLYDEIYTKIFGIYGFNADIDLNQDVAVKKSVVSAIKKELAGARVLDAGCGSGKFLLACTRYANPKRLFGIDAFVKDTSYSQFNLEFRKKSLLNFSLNEEFDLVMSDNVLEHLIPSDLSSHLTCIRNHLADEGKLVIFTPNKLFGPWDVTRIIDYSYSGQTPAQGTHVNEMSCTELVHNLLQAGYTDIQYILPRTGRLGWLSGIRLPVKVILWIESNKPLIRYLQKINKRNCIQLFEIGVIASVRKAL